MTIKNSSVPGYEKLAHILLSVGAILLMLYFGQHILIPLFLSLLFAILLRPMAVFLCTKMNFPNTLAVLSSVIFAVICLAAVIFYISWQVSKITHEWLNIKQNLDIHLLNIQLWLKSQFNLTFAEQRHYIDYVTNEFSRGSSGLMGKTLNSFTDVFINALLIPIYTFLFLLYRNMFTEFLFKLASPKYKEVLSDMLAQIKTVIHSYIVGLFIQMGIVASLTAGGLAILGIHYAVLLGVITAILNLIPYLGIFIATIITVLATLVNSSNLTIVLSVIALSALVQFIDNNLLVPRVVGNKVKINALASIFGVVVGGSIAGIAGMFLVIPMLAIIKVIFDHTTSLSSIGFLLGDNQVKKTTKHLLLGKTK